MNEPDVLPRWDLSDVFPSLDSREFSAATEAFGADIARLGALYERLDVAATTLIPTVSTRSCRVSSFSRQT